MSTTVPPASLSAPLQDLADRLDARRPRAAMTEALRRAQALVIADRLAASDDDLDAVETVVLGVLPAVEPGQTRGAYASELRRLGAATVPAPAASLGVSEPVLGLLATIADLLDVPAPAPDLIDEVKHRRVVADRVGYIQLAIRAILAGEADLGLDWETAYLRRKAEQHPPAYRTLDDLKGEGAGQ
ncbi:hypothetical protein ACFQ8C_13360 [Streptomyces sp. NPDC056503]|uniref:hypothetical protein n=1 Tax=Streptomyces sp. NPDC056503 TaxID=3345842 RepID=UPI003693979B